MENETKYSWFLEYLSHKLEERGIDSSVYAGYILPLFVSGDLQLLLEIYKQIDLQPDAEIVLHQTQAIYQRGFLLPSEKSAIFSITAENQTKSEIFGDSVLELGLSNVDNINLYAEDANYQPPDILELCKNVENIFIDQNESMFLSKEFETNNKFNFIVSSQDDGVDQYENFQHIPTNNQQYAEEGHNQHTFQGNLPSQPWEGYFYGPNSYVDWSTNVIEEECSILNASTHQMSLSNYEPDSCESCPEIVDFLEYIEEEETFWEEEFLSFSSWMVAVQKIEDLLQGQLKNGELFSTDSICWALSKAEMIPEKATAMLLEARKLVDACKPCRHMLTGKCMRKGCWFDHDLMQFPCRYWLLSSCALQTVGQLTQDSPENFANVCPFMHDLPYLEFSLLNEAAQDSSKPSLDASSFPQLSENFEPKSSFNKLNPRNLEFAKALLSKSGNSVQTVKNDSSKRNERSQLTKSRNKQIVLNELQELLEDVSPSKSIFEFYKSNEVALRAVEWVPTGDVVGRDYETLRREARQYAIGRNKLFEQATRAYISGSRKEAKALSQLGHQLNDEMKQCHKEAARAIFKKRNSIPQMLRGQVDLHGLHVAEVQEYLHYVLPLLKELEVNTVNLITGSGHHSKHPRLLPAVRKFCEEMCFKIKLLEDGKAYIGAIQIQL